LKLPTRYNPPPMTSAPASINSDARGPTLLGTFRATPMDAYPPGGAMSCTPTRGGGRGGVACGAMAAGGVHRKRQRSGGEADREEQEAVDRQCRCGG